MTNIQEARNALAKWRDSTPGPWTYAQSRVLTESGHLDIASDLYSWDARLIVGTAGNPELLDAIDMAFVALIEEDPLVSTVTSQCVERIAAAIIAADERMNA